MAGVDLTEGISHACIECDGPDCGKSSPQLRCSRCRTVYYCSTKCQKKHWKEHKPYCLPLAVMRERADAPLPWHNKSELVLLEEENASVDPHQECRICFSSPLSHPVAVRSCGHVFCTRCLLEWQTQSHKFQSLALSSATTCPLCRAQAQDVELNLLARAAMLAGEANVRTRLTDDERLRLRRQALDCLDQVLALPNANVQAYFTKAELLVACGDGEAAVETVNTLLEENEKRYDSPLLHAIAKADEAMQRGDVEEAERLQELVIEMYETSGSGPTRMDHASVFATHCLQSKAYQLLGDWKHAMDCYRQALNVVDDPNIVGAVELRKLWMGASECAFKAGEYEKAIQASEAAIMMNRHFPGVHKHKAMALKELGRLDHAVETMNQAVLYETPWDNGNITEALRLYNHLLAEHTGTRTGL